MNKIPLKELAASLPSLPPSPKNNEAVKQKRQGRAQLWRCPCGCKGTSGEMKIIDNRRACPACGSSGKWETAGKQG